MILITIDQAAIEAVTDQVNMLNERMRVGVRLGMRDALRGLAQAESEAAAVHHKTGLLEKILGKGTKVIETDDEITGVYRPRYPGKQEHYWMEFGAHVPAVTDKLMDIRIPGEEFFRTQREEVEIPAHPFFFDTAESFKDQFMEMLQARVQEALEA